MCILMSFLVMMVDVHNRLRCMYIHYALCILKFYEVCLDLVGFCLLGLSIDHDRRFKVVIVSTSMYNLNDLFHEVVNYFLNLARNIVRAGYESVVSRPLGGRSKLVPIFFGFKLISILVKGWFQFRFTV